MMTQAMAISVAMMLMTALTMHPRNSLTSRPGSSRVMRIALWSVQVLTALVFLFTGSLKLGGFDQAVAMFGQIGFGQWFRYLAGVLEIAGAVLLLVPSFATAGAGLLALVMVGAIIVHLFFSLAGGSLTLAVILLVVTLWIGWQRRGQFLQ